MDNAEDIKSDLHRAIMDAEYQAHLWSERSEHYAARTTLMRSHPDIIAEWEVVAMRAKCDAAAKISNGFRSAAELMQSAGTLSPNSLIGGSP